MNHKSQPLIKRFSGSSDSQSFAVSEQLRLDVLSQLVVLETLCFPKPLGMLFFQDGFLRPDVFIDILLLGDQDPLESQTVLSQGFHNTLNQGIPNDEGQLTNNHEDPQVLVGYSYSQKFVDEMHLIQIGIHPLLRRRGYGKLLAEHAILTAEVEGCHSFWLEVREGNQAAIALYEQLGFETVFQRKKYYSDNGENAWVMKKPMDHFHPSE